MTMNPDTIRSQIRIAGLGRIGIGVSAMLWPSLMAKGWVGKIAYSNEVMVLSRSMGARDAALGSALLVSEINKYDLGKMLHLCALVDFVDFIATFKQRSSLPKLGKWIVALGALASCVWHEYLAFNLPTIYPNKLNREEERS